MDTNSPRLHSVSWDEIQAWIAEVAAASADYDCVVGVARGAVTPLVMLSYALDDLPILFAYRTTVRHATDPFYVFEDGRNERYSRNAQAFRLTEGPVGRRALILDDVVTFGDTLEIVSERVAAAGAVDISYWTYAADLNVLGDVRPEIAAKLRNQEQIDNKAVWMVFPWQQSRKT